MVSRDTTPTDDMEKEGSGEGFLQGKQAQYPITCAKIHLFFLYILLLILLLTVFVTGGLIAGIVIIQVFRRRGEKTVFQQACSHGWIGLGSKCFYFSEDIRNWTFSQLFCTLQEANLVQIENVEELNFLKRYKGRYDHWIGLNRESSSHSWKWTNNAGYNISFAIRGNGECAYLNDNGVSSGRIFTERKWICCKPSNYVDRCPIS